MILERLKDLLETPTADPDQTARFGEDDHRLAAASLLVHVLNADGEEKGVEHAMLETMLVSKFELNHHDTKLLIKAASLRDEEEIDFQAFTTVIKRSYEPSECLQLVEMIMIARHDHHRRLSHGRS